MNYPLNENLRRLRAQKQLTQERAAEALGVSAASISRWECGSTMPDVLLLPEIARLYGMTVDDLFRAQPRAYANYAQRLTAAFRASRCTRDFSQAEAEFEKLRRSGAEDSDDLRSFGVLNQLMAIRCQLRAVELYDAAIECARREGDAQALWKARRQRAYFLARIGRGSESIDAQLAAVRERPDDVEEWILLVAAQLYAGEAEAALGSYGEAAKRFPESAMLETYAGDACAELERYGEAFPHWERALELDPSMRDARFSKASAHEALGNYAEAHALWIALVDELQAAGLDEAISYPQSHAERCLTSYCATSPSASPASPSSSSALTMFCQRCSTKASS